MYVKFHWNLIPRNPKTKLRTPWYLIDLSKKSFQCDTSAFISIKITIALSLLIILFKITLHLTWIKYVNYTFFIIGC